MPTYRIFHPAGVSLVLPEGAQVVEQHQGFTIMESSAEISAALKRQYPVEEILIPSELDDKTVGVPEVVGAAGAAVAATVALSSPRVVRFRTPMTRAAKLQIEAAGAQVLQPLGRSALVVQVNNPESLEALNSIPSVSRVEAYVPKINIRPDFFEGLLDPVSPENLNDQIASAHKRLASGEIVSRDRRGSSVPGMLIASFFTVGDCRRAEEELRGSNVKLVESGSTDRLLINVSGSASPSDVIQAVVSQNGLRSLEEKRIKSLYNDVAREVIGRGVVSGNGDTGHLTGRGEVIGIADSGIDTGQPATLHLDFQGRVRNIASYPIAPSFSSWVTNPGGDDGALDKYSGHGTHVAGSALGNGAQAIALNLPPVRGMAPEAELVFQAIEQSPQWTAAAQLEFLKSGQQPPASGLFGIPEDLRQLFGQAYALGARIHSNSWGGGEPGVYDEQCYDLDRFVWENKDFLILVAAGNSGRHSSPNPQCIDETSIDSPGTAKNCLTVGACENDRAGQFADTYGQWWEEKFAHLPFNSDGMVDSIDDIVAFSSRGPCKGGRRKPDVVAPGTFILSTRSSVMPANNFSWGAYLPAKRHYMFMGGTSMATPLVAGSAALVRQHLRGAEGIANPSAALLKAALIHSTDYIRYRYPHAASQRWADNEQGWGRLNLSRTLAPSASVQVLFVDEALGLRTGESREYQVEITDDSNPFRIILVYSDAPGDDLVNNLNLVVYEPGGGGYYLGNDFEETGTPDRVNNVEGIVVEGPRSGVWRVTVVGSEVLEGVQDFALVLSGSGARMV